MVLFKLIDQSYFLVFYHLIKHKEAHSSLNHNSCIFYRQRALGNIKAALYAYGNATAMRLKYGRL